MICHVIQLFIGCYVHATKEPMMPKKPISNRLNRRFFLKSSSVMMALPAMESFGEANVEKEGAENFVAVGTYLGYYAKGFYPEKVGKLDKLSKTLEPLNDLKHKFTVFSGFDHRATNGHDSWTNFLCGQFHKTYSLDQLIADEIGQGTRYPSIELSAGAGESSSEMSFIKEGIALPMIQRPSVFYKKLFMSKQDVKYAKYILETGQSSLDFVYQDAKSLANNLTARDRQKMDEYFSSLRGVEKRMKQSLASFDKPIPKTTYKLPAFDPLTPNLQLEAEDLMYDLMTLALDTKSTKVLSLFIHGLGQVFTIDGRTLSTGYHGLSHHGNDPVLVNDLMTVDKGHVRCLSRFLKQLEEKKDTQGKSLLDKTIVLMGTGMGDASRHYNGDLPTIVAGGGFKHGYHIHEDRQAPNAAKLGNVYVSILNKLGLEIDHFSNARGNLGERFC